MSVDFSRIDRKLRAMTDSRAGTRAALSAKAYMDRFVRKDSGQLADTAEVSPWRVKYPKDYAADVWGDRVPVVSPRNPGAKPYPERQRPVIDGVRDDLADYIRRL